MSAWKPVFIPLYPMDHPTRAKRPRVEGYTDLSYQGVAWNPDKALGLRTDNLFVIDCDTEEIAEAWAAEPGTETPLTQKSKRGKHFFYRGAPGERQGPVIPGHMDQKTTNTGFVVVYDPAVVEWLTEHGTEALPTPPLAIIARIRPEKKVYAEGEQLEVIGEGERSHKLASLAGAMRRQGLGFEDINETLQRTNETKCVPPLPEEEVAAIAKSISRYAPQPDAKPLNVAELVNIKAPTKDKRRIILTPLSEIEPEAITWLWEGRMPKGSLSLLGGQGAAGKSTLSFDLASSITKGTLKGVFYGQPKGVLIAASEDSFSAVIVPRLMADGADLGKIYQLSTVEGEMGISLTHDMGEVAEIAQETDAALIIFDPIISKLGNLDTHKDSDVRQALEPLKEIAEHTGCAVLGLIHVNKGDSSDPLQRLMGSAAFGNVARSVMTAYVDPEDKTKKKRLLAHTKCNVGPDMETLSFSIGTAEIRPGITASKISWGGDDPRNDRDIIAAGKQVPERMNLAQKAEEFLEEYLTEHGPTQASTLFELGALDGLKKHTLQRARQALSLVITKDGLGTVWRLPGTLGEIAGGE